MRSKKEWTWKTGATAGAGNDTVAGAALETAQALETRVEGPYTLSEHGYQYTDNIVCVVGGTGITGALCLALWWLENRVRDENPRFSLIWTVRYRGTAQLSEWARACRRCEADVQHEPACSRQL